MKRTLLAALMLSALALPPGLGSQVLPFEVLGLKDGIPQSQVTALALDQEGYLWVGTWGGLARFNGSEFKQYPRQDGLHSTRIHELLVGADGTLWIATVGGLSRWSDHRLEMIMDPLVSSVRCRALAEDFHRRIWIGTDNGVVVLDQGKFQLLHPGGTDGPVVYDILADREGILVAAENGLWRYSSDLSLRKEETPAEVDCADFRALATTAEGLWLGASKAGLWLRGTERWEKVGSGETAPRTVYHMTVQQSGTLYIATGDNGVFVKRPGQPALEHWGMENGLPSNVVNALIEDRENNIWVATDIGGLGRLSNTAVINHTETQGLPSSCVFAIIQGDSPDSLWLATMRGAVHYQVRPRPRVLETVGAADGLDNEFVWKVLRTDDGTLWFLTDTALFFRLKGEKSIRPLSPEVPFPRTNPYDIVVDRQGNLWGCGEWSGGGLVRRDKAGTWRAWKQTASGEALTAVHRLARSRRGGVYAVAKSTFYFCDGQNVTPLGMFSSCPLESSVSITAIMEDSGGRLWAGNDAGLALLQTDGKWLPIDQRLGFPNHHVFSIGEDVNANVWVNTNHGVFRFTSDLAMTEFNTDDGLASLETNANGFFSDSRGDIWIGTVSGLSQYTPARRTANTEPPRLIVESARLPKRSIEYPQRLDLAWNERTLAFDIAILSYRNRNRTAYRARMDGLESDWLPLRHLGELRYTNLPAGDLQLLLQPVNESGVWGATITLPIHVRPPFWMTLWFRLGGLIFLLAAAVVVYRWRTLLLRRRNRELEKEVGKRTAELEYLATYDPLTTLFNRRAILAFLERQLKPERGSNRQLGCIMIDLNHFKQVNDTLGHAAGDQVLRDMAARIQECLRQGDALGRLGGDEFLVILPGTDAGALHTVESRISNLICQAGEGATVVTVTAACGAVRVPTGNTAAAATILAQADELLYQVKRARR